MAHPAADLIGWKPAANLIEAHAGGRGTAHAPRGLAFARRGTRAIRRLRKVAVIYADAYHSWTARPPSW